MSVTHDLSLPVLRCIITVLFVAAAAECAHTLFTDRRAWRSVISQVLHITMALAMTAMAWPATAGLPTTAPMVFFALATVWFVVLVLTRPGHRAVNAYHAVMMLAMVWMYAAMSGSLVPAPMQGVVAGGDHGPHSMAMPGMPGMAMPATDASAVGNPPLVVGLNWLCVIGFAAAALWWSALVMVRRRTGTDTSGRRLAGIAAQAMMAAGMALMFGLMLS